MKTAIRLPLWRVLVALALAPGVFTQPQPVSAPALATIPADVTVYGGIFLRARVNNSQPLWFALDSGASSPFFIDSRRARALGLKLQGHFTREGGAGPGTYEVAETRRVSISLSGLKFTDQTAHVIDFGEIEAQAGRPLDGLVGIYLFTRYVVEIDYFGNEITLYDPKTYAYSGAGESIPLTLRDGHFFVPAKIEMPGRPRLDGQFLVDTGGCLVTAVLTTPFAQSNNLPNGLPWPTQKTILDRSLSGLGGETRLLVSRATSFTLGNLSVREPVIYVSQDRGGALASPDYEGLIGSEILRRFKVIFDYARGRLILEANAHYAEPVEYDMSGISLRAYRKESVHRRVGVATGSPNQLKTFRVYQVIADSPAAEAGVRVGDVLTAIDGVPAARFTLDEINQMLKVPGREYKLNFKRGAGTLSMKIKMRRLI
jgi:predicted aspartyl protease